MIARAIGISDETLRKYFTTELQFGLSKRRQEVVDILYAAARKGNVAAAKRIEEMTRLAAVTEAVSSRGEPVKPPKLGKKEERQAAAQAVTGKYEPPAPPKLVVNNQ